MKVRVLVNIGSNFKLDSRTVKNEPTRQTNQGPDGPFGGSMLVFGNRIVNLPVLSNSTFWVAISCILILRHRSKRRTVVLSELHISISKQSIDFC